MKSFTSFAAILAAASASRAHARDFDLASYDSGFYGGYDAQPVVVTPVVYEEDDHHRHVHHHDDGDYTHHHEGGDYHHHHVMDEEVHEV